jgi:type II secretory pathway pseudopilin PulG
MTRHRSAACVAMLRGAQRDAGFTVLEALVSFIVFAIVATSASYGLVKAIDASHKSQQRVDAADVAQALVADAIRRAGAIGGTPAEGTTVYAGVGPTFVASDGTTKDSESFTVVETVAYDTPGDCNLGNLFWVHIVVKQQQSGQVLARSDARVACPRV